MTSTGVPAWKRASLWTRALIGLSLLLLSAVEARAQWIVAINPGVKMGWVLGSGEGPFFGVEVSVSALRRATSGGKNGGYGFGLVLQTYRIRGSGITHIGAEAMYMGLGMQVGPSFLTNADGSTSTGVSVEGFYGAGIFAHAERTFLFDGGGWWQAGFYGKLPIPIHGKLPGPGG